MARRTIIIVFVLLLQHFPFYAQFESTFYTDFGKNNVSDGLQIKTALLGKFVKEDFKVSAGIQLDLKNPFNKYYTGTNLHLSRETSVRNIIFEPEAFYLLNSFSKNIYEHNFGLLINYKQTHFTYKLGTHFRHFRITGYGANMYNIDEHLSLTEKWNLLYLIKYQIKQEGHKWNAGLALRNIDHFTINQETNPVFNAFGHIRLSEPFALFTEVWYKSAGALNISVNYFGFFIRTGIVWQAKL